MPVLNPIAKILRGAVALTLLCLQPIVVEAQGVSAVTPEASQVLPPPVDKIKTFKWDRFVPSGVDQKIGSAVLVNPDCSPMGKVYGRVITPPTHGQIDFEEAEDFSSWAPNTVRDKCNDKKYPSLRVMYKSDENFTGSDFARVVILIPDGTAIQWDFTIDVM